MTNIPLWKNYRMLHCASLTASVCFYYHHTLFNIQKFTKRENIWLYQCYIAYGTHEWSFDPGDIC